MPTATRQQFCSRCGERNRDTYIVSARRNSAADQAENLRLVLSYLRRHPCVDCGERDPVVLDLHHRDPSLELMEVSLLVWRSTSALLEAEIARCDVRCANCHRRRTAIQRGWRKLAFAITEVAGAAGLEPATCRFGDDRSTS